MDGMLDSSVISAVRERVSTYVTDLVPRTNKRHVPQLSFNGRDRDQ